MRHRSVACACAALMSVGLLQPSDVAAQPRRPRGSSSVGRAVRAARPVRVVRPVYSRVYFSYAPYSWYWGWGGWYPSPYFYGYGPYRDPFWYGYGPWGYRYYYDDSASVRVQGAPRDTQVYVDGYYVGVVDDFDGVFQRLRVPPGGHEITLRLKGFRNSSDRVYLQPNSTFHLRARLEPLPPDAPEEPPPTPNPDTSRSEEYRRPRGEREPPEPTGPPSHRWPAREQAEEQQAARESRFGTLTVRVQPADAEVIVDGTPWGGPADQEGALAIQLPAGTHRIEVRREGFVSYVADVNVRASTATPLNVMLQREN
jgi:PEGA domain-containing protein